MLQDAAAQIGRAGPASAQSMLVDAAKQDTACASLLGAGWSVTGYAAARLAVRAGGTPESLVGAMSAIEALEKLATKPDWRVESEYAEAAIRAAMAAAQDERGEMAVYLTHARGLSDRLTLAKATPTWPLPIDTLEGDLWLEVDRYKEALAAFERARKIGENGLVLIGLGRTRARLGDEKAACGAYRQAMMATEGGLLDEAKANAESPICSR
jgi:tetratricopeptide (TPR) repeat protein